MCIRDSFFEIEEALEAGFVDEIAEPDQVLSAAIAKAEEFLKLDLEAHKGSKLRLREPLLATLRVAIDRDIEVWEKRQL